MSVKNTMFDVLKTAFNKYWSGEEAMTPEKALALLAQDDEIEPENFEPETLDEHADNACTKKTGRITLIDEHFGIIDNKYYFDNVGMANGIPHLRVGMEVRYVAFNIDGKNKAKVLGEVDDEWSNSEKETNLWYPRKLVGKVSERKKRTVVINPPNITCDLNKVESFFIPMVGDWVEIHAITEVDESVQDFGGEVLEVVSIAPLRTQMTDGIIKRWNPDSMTGIINSDIHFDIEVCTPGYEPLIRDKVVANILESQQGACSWRAVRVMPMEKTNSNLGIKDMTVSSELFHDKNDIKISTKANVMLNRLGDKDTFVMEILNNGSSKKLLQVKFHSKDTQLKLLSPDMKNGYVVNGKCQTMVKFLCTATTMGTAKELVSFIFDGFIIARWVNIRVIPELNKQVRFKEPFRRNDKNFAVTARDSFIKSNKEVVAGERPIKPPSFISNKLPMFEIPERIADALFEAMKKYPNTGQIPIESIAPSLSQSLSIYNYTDFFHNLLYLEELALEINMRKYDIQRACFVKNGEFLMLEVLDLAERRPSVVLGDKVIASNPDDPEAPRLEGFVHKTGARHLYIRFNKNFHDLYKGEDYSVEFHSSRTCFRRYHQAIDLAAKNLGKYLLFPTLVKVVGKQLIFEVEEGNSNNTLALPFAPNDDKEKVKKEKRHFSEGKTALAVEEVKEKENMAPSEEETYDAKYLKMGAVPKTRRNLSISKEKKEQKSIQDLEKRAEELRLSTRVCPVKLEWIDKKLNYYQKEAVKNILYGEARPLPYFIFGPPGTGKTITLIETILQILTLIPHSRLLVVAPSNSAADLIALRLIDSNILIPGDLVRMVAFRCVTEGSIPDRLVPFSVTGDLAREGSRDNRTYNQGGVNIGVQTSALGRHRITVGTCMIVGMLYTMGFPRGHFTHIIIDEAGQATEPEVMIPLSLLDVKSAQTILAGDPLQLGPCVFSMLSKDYGLAESYFERLIGRFPYARDLTGFPNSGGYDPRLVTRLIYNYRSLPEILALPNKLFYNNELKPVISNEHGMEVDLLRQVAEILPTRSISALPPSVVFHGVRGENFQTPDCPSWYNPAEAGQVFFYIADLYRLGLTPDDIGVITPYIKQGQQVKALLIEAELSLPKIGSVEEFQGQEFKVIILSTVRSNEQGARNDSKYGLGFIANARRLNVVISRAQALLIIVGNPHLLSTDIHWRNVLSYAIKIGGYRGCDLPNVFLD